MHKILVIEDNEDIAELLKDDLTAKGFDVIVCGDGLQGIEFVHKHQPNLILLDLMLPAGGGFHVLEKISLSENTKSIPVVVLTASKDLEHRKKAEGFGVHAYLEKPYDSDELIKKIKSVLGEI